MKMAKKLLAVVLAGVLALSVLTGCGNSTSANTKNIADAMSDMLKSQGITVKADSKLDAKAKKVADTLMNALSTTSLGSSENQQIMDILGEEYNDQFVTISITKTKGYNATAQAYDLLNEDNDYRKAINTVSDKQPGKTYHIGTTVIQNFPLDANGTTETVRLAIITAEAVS